MSESTPPQDTVVLQERRHLKWRAFDAIELVLMWFSGLSLVVFCMTVLLDVLLRFSGNPVTWLADLTAGAFVWGLFLGGAVAVRRNQHFYLTAVASSMKGKKRIAIETFNQIVMLIISLAMFYYGYLNFLDGFGSILPASGTPRAALTAAIPIAGFLIALFTIEQFVNGWRNGFEGITRDPIEQVSEDKGMSVE